jgi:hypothetical protein
MLVDVTFDGVALCKGANARPDGNGWFVELEQPMPVGTVLDVSGETQATVRVERVVEGVGAGMLLVPASAEKSKPAPAPKADKPEAKPEAKTEAKPEAKVEAKADDGDDEPDGKEPDGKDKGANGTGKDRRKKTRKTVMGH